MLVIPFANPIGPQSGADGDGVLFGSLPRVAPATVLSHVHLGAFAKVYRGNADGQGAVTFSNVTTAANDDTTGDVSLFDTVNPTADRLCIVLSPGDSVSGISLLVSTAAALTGAPVADVYYRGAAGWVNASSIVTPALTTTGLKKISFTTVAYDDVSPIDDLIDARSAPQIRCLFVQFSGITAVTTAPLFSRIFKNIPHEIAHKSENITALATQGANPNFAAVQAAVLPVANDLTLFGFDERPVRLFPSIYRASNTAHLKEWVYSRTADFAVLPAASLNDQSNRLELTPTTGTLNVRRIRVRLSGSTANTGQHIRNLDIRNATGVRLAATAFTVVTGAGSAGAITTTGGNPVGNAFDASDATYWDVGAPNVQNNTTAFAEAIFNLVTPQAISSVLMATFFGDARTYAMGSVEVTYDRDDGGVLADGSDARWFPLISARPFVVPGASNATGNTFSASNPFGAAGVADQIEHYAPDVLAAGLLTSWAESILPSNNLSQTDTLTSTPPNVVLNAYNGLPTVRFAGGLALATDGEWLAMAAAKTTLRYFIAVFKEDADAVENDVFLLGHGTEYHLHRGPSKQILTNGTASANATGGVWRINGAVVDPLVAVYPTTLSLMSCETAGNVTISQIGRDRNINGRFFDGDICELIFLDRVPGTVEREQIEGYLAWKYALQTALPAMHAYRNYSPYSPAARPEIPLIPPSDWAKQSITDTADESHSRYWVGLRTTTDTATPVLPVNFTLRGQPLKGARAVGIPAPVAETFTQATIVARDTSLAASTLIIVNLTGGTHAVAVLPANTAIATATISLAVSKGDLLAVVQPLGHPTVNLGDGAIYLS